MFNIKNKKVENVVWFTEVGKGDIGLVGGKGANLGELLKAGINVPIGFIVTSGAYYDFLAEAKLLSKIKSELFNINPEDSKKLNAVASNIQEIVLKTPMSEELKKEITENYKKLVKMTQNKFVAVRSSATAEDLPQASFAGQQATFLNIGSEDDLIKAVRECWASLFEPRAIYYRAINKFDHLKVGIAVPVQSMIQSEVSGILFTVDPVSNNEETIVIDAGYGLGEAVVSGSITPDRYVIDKKTLKILSKEINEQTWKIAKVIKGDKEFDKHVNIPKKEQKLQKLPDKMIEELGKQGLAIEKYYKFPQDTEWAYSSGKIYFVQSRPVTTFKKEIKLSEVDGKKTEEEVGKPTDDDIILQGASASVGMASGPVKIIHDSKQIDEVSEGDVLVTEMTTPDFVPAMKRAKAIITDTGGRTCHAAIVSRELGIPCVVGTGKATSILKQGQIVTVNGVKGLVYKGKFTKAAEINNVGSTRQQVMVRQDVPITGTKLYVNLAEVEKAQEISEMPVDGVGLLRAEFMIAGIGKHPRLFIKEKKERDFILKLAEGLKTFSESFNPRPVIYRATDFKSNEYKNLLGGKEFEPVEENPMIGYRGCFRYVKEPDVFNMELEAIKEVRDKAGLRNLQLMIPFVRTPEELKKVKELVAVSGLLDSNDFKLYMMAEVPSNVILIDKFLDVGVHGISIGSNDLTQLILGVDRDSQKMAEEFDERDEAVLIAIKTLIEKCRKRGVSVSICGQAPSTYPEYTEFLVEAGITSISVNPDMIVSGRKLIASCERRIMLKKMLER